MVSFAQLWEQIERNKNPLMGIGEDSTVLAVVRSGMDLHDKDRTSFWDELISLCGNTDGLAELLEVSPEAVRNWPARIREMTDKLEQEDSEDPAEKPDVEMLPTGQTGAVTNNTDPNIGRNQ